MRHDVSSSAIAWLARMLLGVCALPCDVRVAAVTPRVQSDQVSKREIVSDPTIRVLRPEENLEKWPLRVSNLRIEDTSPGEEKPSAVLKFQMLNKGTTKITAIVFVISIVQKPEREQLNDRPRVLAGPFTIRGDIVLEPGYTADYEMLLRTLSHNCRCTATVSVVSVRSVPMSRP